MKKYRESLVEPNRSCDPLERAAILRELAFGRHAERVEQISTPQLSREHLDRLPAGRGVVGHERPEAATAADREVVIARRARNLVPFAERGQQLLGRGLQIVRFVAGDAGLDAVREDALRIRTV